MGMADEYGAHFAENGIILGTRDSSSKSSGSDDGSSSNNNVLSVVALALSIVAIAAVAASFFAKKSAPAGALKEISATPLTKANADDPSLAQPPSVA